MFFMRIEQNYYNNLSNIRKINTFKQNSTTPKSEIDKSIVDAREQVSKQNKKSSKKVLLSSILGTGLGAAIGHFCFKQKPKAGLWGGLAGLLAGFIGGCATNRVHTTK